eukprot:XP_001693942.1 predicted protein [Chlamydomonas reinhardtii]
MASSQSLASLPSLCQSLSRSGIAHTCLEASGLWPLGRRAFHSSRGSHGTLGQRYQPQRPAQSTPIPSTAESAVARNGGHLSSFGGDSSPAAQAFLRSQWPWLAALGFGAAGALAYSVFREPAVTQRVWLEFGVDGQPVGVVVVGLHGGDAPHTADNFEALACHSPGFGYAGVPVHRVMHGWSVWSGDVTQGDGSGGVSAYGASLPLESWGAKHRRGTLSMVLDEDSRLRSQLGDSGEFFFTLVTTPALDRKAAAIGKVLEGLEVLDRISRLPTREGQEGRPKQDDMRSTAELWEAGMRCFNCGLQYDLLGQPYDPQLHDLDPYDPSLLGQPGLGAVVASVVRPGFLVSGCVVVKPLVRVHLYGNSRTSSAGAPPQLLLPQAVRRASDPVKQHANGSSSHPGNPGHPGAGSSGSGSGTATRSGAAGTDRDRGFQAQPHEQTLVHEEEDNDASTATAVAERGGSNASGAHDARRLPPTLDYIMRHRSGNEATGSGRAVSGTAPPPAQQAAAAGPATFTPSDARAASSGNSSGTRPAVANGPSDPLQLLLSLRSRNASGGGAPAAPAPSSTTAAVDAKPAPAAPASFSVPAAGAFAHDAADRPAAPAPVKGSRPDTRAAAADGSHGQSNGVAAADDSGNDDVGYGQYDKPNAVPYGRRHQQQQQQHNNIQVAQAAAPVVVAGMATGPVTTAALGALPPRAGTPTSRAAAAAASNAISGASRMAAQVQAPSAQQRGGPIEHQAATHHGSQGAGVGLGARGSRPGNGSGGRGGAGKKAGVAVAPPPADEAPSEASGSSSALEATAGNGGVALQQQLEGQALTGQRRHVISTAKAHR